MKERRIRFDHLRIGEEFWQGAITGFKRSRNQASLYNDYDEFIGRQHFRPAEMVSIWD